MEEDPPAQPAASNDKSGTTTGSTDSDIPNGRPTEELVEELTMRDDDRTEEGAGSEADSGPDAESVPGSGTEEPNAAPSPLDSIGPAETPEKASSVSSSSTKSSVPPDSSAAHHSQQQQQHPGNANSFPFPFVNPFLTHLPQPPPVSSTAPELNSTEGPSGPMGPGIPGQDPNIRFNPYTGGYFLTPTQYQEMVQQYFKSVMSGMAAQPFPVSNGRPPEPGRPEEGVPPQNPYFSGFPPPFPSMPPAFWGAPQPPGPSPPPPSDHSLQQQPNNGQLAPAPDEKSKIQSNAAPSVEEQVHTEDSCGDAGQEENTANEEGIEAPESIQSSASDEKDSEAISVPKEEGGKKKDLEQRTDTFISKQMTVFEQEVNRRTQKGVKHVDPKELEALLLIRQRGASSEVVAPDGAWAEEESGVPWRGEGSEKSPGFSEPQDTRRLEEIPASSEERKEGAVELKSYQPHFPQAPVIPQFYPLQAAHGQAFAPFPQFPNQPAYPQQFGPPHMASYVQPAFLPPQTQPHSFNQPFLPHDFYPQQHYRLEAQTDGAGKGEIEGKDDGAKEERNGWSEGEGETERGGGVRIPPPPGEEPVWVMRESYLRKMKREEAKEQEKEQEHQQQSHPPRIEKNSTEWEGEGETERDADGTSVPLLGDQQRIQSHSNGDSAPKPHKGAKKKEVMVHEPAVLIEGVLFRARYLGSTQLSCEDRPTKATRMSQAQEAVSRIKAPEGEPQPGTEVDLFISTEKIMVLNTDLQRISDTDVRQDIMMDHPLRTISYIADIGDIVVLMARRVSQSSSPDCPDPTRRMPRIICHVFESEESQFIAQSIGQAFQVAYMEFLRANGIDDPRTVQAIDYEEVLNSQEIMGDELEMFARRETQKDVVVPKQKGESMGMVVVESGWGSMLPTVVIANLQPTGPAARCNQLNIGDQITCINGISLVGLPLSAAQTQIKNTKTQTAVKLTVVNTPPVVEVRIKRPDTKYQLGFSVQNGVICSLLRGGIAERGGVRVGHRIIEINHQSVVAVAHEKIVNMLATAVGEIQMKTMPTSMFRLLTGQETPIYI